MIETGKGRSVTKGMYLDGEISINNVYAVTKRREFPCNRCFELEKINYMVLDLALEKNMVSKSCNDCIRSGQKCEDQK